MERRQEKTDYWGIWYICSERAEKGKDAATYVERSKKQDGPASIIFVYACFQSKRMSTMNGTSKSQAMVHDIHQCA